MLYLKFILILSFLAPIFQLHAVEKAAKFLRCNSSFSKRTKIFPDLEKTQLKSKHFQKLSLVDLFKDRVGSVLKNELGAYKKVRWLGEGESGLVFIVELKDGSKIVVKYYLDRRNLSEDLRRFHFAKLIADFFELPLRVPDRFRLSNRILLLPYIEALNYQQALTKSKLSSGEETGKPEELFDWFYEDLTEAYSQAGSLSMITDAESKTEFQTPKKGVVKLHIHRGNLLIDSKGFWLIDPY